MTVAARLRTLEAQAPRLTVWWCDECGYGRLDKSTGRHQTTNPDDWRGAMLIHELRPVTFVMAHPAMLLLADLAEAAELAEETAGEALTRFQREGCDWCFALLDEGDSHDAEMPCPVLMVFRLRAALARVADQLDHEEERDG